MFSSPQSRAGMSCEQCTHNTKRISWLESKVRKFIVAKNLQDEFDDNSESDGGPVNNNDKLNYSDDAPTKYNIDEEDGQPSQPPNVRRSGRKRSTPQKLKSPVMSVKRGRKTAQGTHE